MIYIVGLGPGNIDYITPIAVKTIKQGDVVIGGKRNLESVITFNENQLLLNFQTLARYLCDEVDKKIVIVVSGDTGFYSMINYVKNVVKEEGIKVIPGISSLSYFYAALNKSYEDAVWISLHGRDQELVDYIKGRKELAILTDDLKNSQYIAKIYKDYLTKEDLLEDYKNLRFYIGEWLSYDYEKIQCLDLEQCIGYCGEDLSVVIVRYEG